MRADLGGAGLSLLVFGFLALMAWTGKLAGIDGVKVGPFAWIVEDVGVGHFGRAGATALFAGLGLVSVPVVLRVRRRLGARHQGSDIGAVARTGTGQSGREASEMSGGVWMSGVLNPAEIGNKQGSRTKFYGQEWNPAEFILPVPPPNVMDSLRRYKQGYCLGRTEFPEAEAVWNEKRFAKRRDLFFVGPFFAVQGRLAEVLSRFDLGEGGLIPFPIYQADLATPYPGEFFLLNFGAIKNSILPEQCEDARKFLIRKATGKQIWHINDFKPDGEVVLSQQALVGPELWFEEAAHDKVFMSDGLAQAIIDIGMGDVFRLKQCRIAGGAA